MTETKGATPENAQETETLESKQRDDQSCTRTVRSSSSKRNDPILIAALLASATIGAILRPSYDSEESTTVAKPSAFNEEQKEEQNVSHDFKDLAIANTTGNNTRTSLKPESSPSLPLHDLGEQYRKAWQYFRANGQVNPSSPNSFTAIAFHERMDLLIAQAKSQAENPLIADAPSNQLEQIQLLHSSLLHQETEPSYRAHLLSIAEKHFQKSPSFLSKIYNYTEESYRDWDMENLFRLLNLLPARNVETLSNSFYDSIRTPYTSICLGFASKQDNAQAEELINNSHNAPPPNANNLVSEIFEIYSQRYPFDHESLLLVRGWLMSDESHIRLGALQLIESAISESELSALNAVSLFWVIDSDTNTSNLLGLNQLDDIATRYYVLLGDCCLHTPDAGSLLLKHLSDPLSVELDFLFEIGRENDLISDTTIQELLNKPGLQQGLLVWIRDHCIDNEVISSSLDTVERLVDSENPLLSLTALEVLSNVDLPYPIDSVSMVQKLEDLFVNASDADTQIRTLEVMSSLERRYLPTMFLQDIIEHKIKTHSAEVTNYARYLAER